MNEFGKFQANRIQLHRADIVTASIENPLEMVGKDVAGFNFGLAFSIGFNPDKKIIKTELEVNVRTNLEEYENQATGRFRIAFLFGIENFGELVHVDGKEIKASDELVLALTSITHSTSRGILLTRFQGTVFKNFILPVMSPGEILNQQNESKGEG